MSNSGSEQGLPQDALAVLQFWFLELMPENWFSSSNAIDEAIAVRFGAVLERAKTGALDEWRFTPRGRLALVIVLDQFSRNIHRGQGEAFAQDHKAQGLVLEAIATGEDERLGLDERQFLYMPLMHAEDGGLQAIALERYAALAKSAAAITDFARKHSVIIKQFGRFPYRNPMIGRASTPDEQAFIATEGNPFS